jgi:hypothetical protein
LYSQKKTMSGELRARYTHTNLVARNWRKLARFEVVTFDVPAAGTITWTYARDPEENIIELQSWS